MAPSTPNGTPQKASAGTTVGSTTFSGSELQLMIAVLTRYSQNQPLDWPAIAEETGYKSGSVCSTRWGQIKRQKLGISSTSGQTASTPSARSGGSKISTPRKRKAGKDAVPENEERDDEVDENESLSRKKAKSEGGVVVKTEDEDGEAGISIDDVLSA